MGTPNDDHLRVVSAATTQELFGLYGTVLAELKRRGVIRTMNAPVGDYAEFLTTRVYSGELAPPSAKSWDVLAEGGLRLQVKSRVDRGGGNFSFIRSWDFDACVFVRFDVAQYDVISAVEVPVDSVRSRARRSEHVNGARIRVRDDLTALPGAVDCTAAFRASQ